MAASSLALGEKSQDRKRSRAAFANRVVAGAVFNHGDRPTAAVRACVGRTTPPAAALELLLGTAVSVSIEVAVPAAVDRDDGAGIYITRRFESIDETTTTNKRGVCPGVNALHCAFDHPRRSDDGDDYDDARCPTSSVASIDGHVDPRSESRSTNGESRATTGPDLAVKGSKI